MASTPDSDRSYLTRCSQVDCMRSMSKRGNFIAARSSLASALLGVRAEPLQLLLGELEHVRAFEGTRLPGDFHGTRDVGIAKKNGHGYQITVGGRLLERERARLFSDGLPEIGLDRPELERPRAELVGRHHCCPLVCGRNEDGVDRAAHEGISVLDERSDVADG